MNVSELDNLTAIDKPAEVARANAVPKGDLKAEVGAQPDKAAGDARSKAELTAGGLTRYLQGISTSSCGEIDTLISDLRVLREKLVGDGDRIERDLVEFATLNQSVLKLTEVVMDSVTHVKTPSHRK